MPEGEDYMRTLFSLWERDKLAPDAVANGILIQIQRKRLAKLAGLGDVGFHSVSLEILNTRLLLIEEQAREAGADDCHKCGAPHLQGGLKAVVDQLESSTGRVGQEVPMDKMPILADYDQETVDNLPTGVVISRVNSEQGKDDNELLEQAAAKVLETYKTFQDGPSISG